MSFADFLFERFEAHRDADAVVWRGQSFNYGWLLERFRTCREMLFRSGEVVSLEADFSPSAIAALLALIDRDCIVVPITTLTEAKREECLEIAEIEVCLRLGSDGQFYVERETIAAKHSLYQELRGRRHPGLVLFSSGSTGRSKAAVHDFAPILDKFRLRRHSRRAIALLQFDHIGGLNTLLYTLSNTGCLIVPPDRSPDGVLGAVEEHRAELLPASPTFLNLMLLSEAHRRYDLSSLRLVTYGAEPMPESTLARLRAALPQVELQQTYGLSEIGILRSKSRSRDSLWVKLGGEGVRTRVVDGMLQIQSPSAMLGYLNAPSPFTEDGWLPTGDIVEQDGEYYRILGRDSDVINVGGKKVHPAEIESAIEGLENIAAVTVYAEPNPITGSIVCAKVFLADPEEPKSLARRIKQHCRRRLEPWKVPVRVVVVDESSISDRFKKRRDKA